jgi:hypothetical protein
VYYFYQSSQLNLEVPVTFQIPFIVVPLLLNAFQLGLIAADQQRTPLMYLTTAAGLVAWVSFMVLG